MRIKRKRTYVLPLMQRVGLILLSMMLVVSGQPYARAVELNPSLKIGLFYNTTALSSSNLLNQTGAGYEFGYLDAARNFISVGKTAETAITMVKNRNMYVANGTYSESQTTGSTLVGCYHIDTGVTYASFDEAAAQAKSLRDQGRRAFPVYANGNYYVRIGAYASSATAKADLPLAGFPDALALTGSQYCISVTVTASGEIIFQYDGPQSTGLAVFPTAASGVIPITWNKGYRYYGGFEFARMTGNNITVANIVSMQDYIKGVIPYEMSPSWPLEALKAQALCAKSYAVQNMGKHKAYGLDLCNTTDCQVYYGTGSASQNSDRAVDETFGLYVMYGNQVATTFYHSSNGGYTEDSINVWSADLPYLKAVPDNFEDLSRAAHGIWRFECTNEDLTKIMAEKKVSTGKIVNAYIDQYTPAGNVYRLTLVDENGKKYNFEKERARTILNSASVGVYTYSQRYSISSGSSLSVISASGTTTKGDTNGLYVISSDGVSPLDVPLSQVQLRAQGGLYTVSAGKSGVYVIEGRGWGHNVGMSQNGARGMAERGYTYDQIIKHYFTGVSISG